jgi:hypothetical protein
MSDDSHAQSSADDQAVVRYLAALETRRSAPDTLPQPDDAAAGLAGFEFPPGDDAEVDDLAAQLGKDVPGAGQNLADLEPGFVAAAADYGRRHGITYDGWRNAGVSDDVLARAGITAADA